MAPDIVITPDDGKWANVNPFPNAGMVADVAGPFQPGSGIYVHIFSYPYIFAYLSAGYGEPNLTG